MKRAVLSVLVLLTVAFSARAQYVFVIGQPANGGEIRVGKDANNLGAYQDGSSLIDDAQPGETVYFDFRPYSGWEFSGAITCDDLSSENFTLRDDGIYQFTMPNYEGMMMLMIYVGFQKETVVATGVDITEANFPDAKFRAWLLAQDYGADGVITDAEMSTIGIINAPYTGIEDLTGIAHFTNLQTLWVYNNADTPEADRNNIAAIDLSALPYLRELKCGYNNISSLDLSQCPDLITLDCSNNALTQLDVTSNQYLRLLYCMDNQLTALNVMSNPDLAVLSCYGNQLTTLDVSQNLALEQLFCENNQLAAIDVTNHAKLMLFNCNNNQLTALDVTGCPELFQLYCYNNSIKGEAMQTLVNSLRDKGGYMVVLDRDNGIEQNEIDEEQIAIAKAKGWSVEAWEDNDFMPILKTHEYVDLGLPSGTLWASSNVGAYRPQDAGLFFAWGDTEGHGTDPDDGYLYSWENYKWANVVGEDTYFTKYCSDSSRGLDGFTDGKSVLDPDDDAAFVNWGSEWRTPTKEQFEELRDVCTWTPMTIGDISGYDVEGPNGNTLFLSEAGWRIDDMMLEGGSYWSRTTSTDDVGGAYQLAWDEWGWYTFGGRLNGQSVRPVSSGVRLKANSDGEGSYWATYYNHLDALTADENTKVYTATLTDDKTQMELTEVSDKTIPSGNAVVLESTAEEINLSYNGAEAATLPGNELQGAATAFDTPDNTYMLVGGARGVGFYHWTGASVPAFRACIVLPATAGVREFIPIATPIETGIGRLENRKGDNSKPFTGYTLDGRRLNDVPTVAGIYVINGKKTVIR